MRNGHRQKPAGQIGGAWHYLGLLTQLPDLKGMQFHLLAINVKFHRVAANFTILHIGLGGNRRIY